MSVFRRLLGKPSLDEEIILVKMSQNVMITCAEIFGILTNEQRQELGSSSLKWFNQNRQLLNDYVTFAKSIIDLKRGSRDYYIANILFTMCICENLIMMLEFYPNYKYKKKLIELTNNTAKNACMLINHFFPNGLPEEFIQVWPKFSDAFKNFENNSMFAHANPGPVFACIFPKEKLEFAKKTTEQNWNCE